MSILRRLELPRHEHPFIGTWRIFAMEMWTADYFNMAVQAFIEVRPDNLGSFQFGLINIHHHVRSQFKARRVSQTAMPGQTT